MLRRLHLVLAALAMFVAPLAMQSGMAMAARPMDHYRNAQAGQCDDEDIGGRNEPNAMTQCCAAICSAVVLLGAASLVPIIYHAPMHFVLRSTEHREFVAKLPTPPPRHA